MRSAIKLFSAASLMTLGALVCLPGGSAHAATIPASTGGGCQYASYNGYRVGACISASNNVVYPDYYVTNLPNVNKCYIDATVFHNGDNVGGFLENCGIGHVNLIGGSASGSWYDEVIVWVNGRPIIDDASPIEQN